MKTYSLIILLTILITGKITAQWDPNAGLIPSLTDNAIITCSSGTDCQSVTDGNPMTYWESSSPLPENYISKRDLNYFLSQNNYNVTTSHSSAKNAFDGILSSNADIVSGNLIIDLKQQASISLFSIKLNVVESVKITFIGSGDNWEFYYTPQDNYGLKTYELPDNSKITSIIFESIDSFSVFEIAGLMKNPVESLIIDLGKEEEIGWIGSRHYNGDGVISIDIDASVDGSNWKRIASLNPMATAFVTQVIDQEVRAKYIRVNFKLKSRKYQKAKLHEIVIYDKYGPYGKSEPPVRAIKKFSESFGINTIWGWGYSVASDKLPDNSGAFLFNKIAKLARNYHSISWDINKPGDDPDYNKMKNGNGTSATPWMNWYSEYTNWQNAGFDIDVCLMFNNKSFNDTLWKDTQREAFIFGNHFGSFFSEKNKIISLVEVGNEPWEYSKSKYRDILKGMSEGLSKNGSSQILPCATQAYSVLNPHDNYISDYVIPDNSKFITGLNTHLYSYIFDHNGNRTAINPEDPRSETWSVLNMKRFSKSNLNNIPVYVTEFGYDSHGGGEDCTHDVCVSELEQAIYGTRMALILYRLGVEEFYWYYFANVDYSSMLHNRSGLLSSYSKGFSKKMSFDAFSILQQQLGDYYFSGIIKEDNDAYVYSFCDESGQIKKIVAWRPTSDNHENGIWVEFPSSYVVRDVVSIENGSDVQYVRKVKNLNVLLTGTPVIFTVE